MNEENNAQTADMTGVRPTSVLEHSVWFLESDVFAYLLACLLPSLLLRSKLFQIKIGGSTSKFLTTQPSNLCSNVPKAIRTD